MDLDQVWKDAIANVISKFTDLKDMSVVKCKIGRASCRERV